MNSPLNPFLCQNPNSNEFALLNTFFVQFCSIEQENNLTFISSFLPACYYDRAHLHFVPARLKFPLRVHRITQNIARKGGGGRKKSCKISYTTISGRQPALSSLSKRGFSSLPAYREEVGLSARQYICLRLQISRYRNGRIIGGGSKSRKYGNNLVPPPHIKFEGIELGASFFPPPLAPLYSFPIWEEDQTTIPRKSRFGLRTKRGLEERRNWFVRKEEG